MRLALICFLLGGCNRLAPEPPSTFKEADVQFLRICRDEYRLSPVLKGAGRTLWIYLPLEKPLFEMKANREGPKNEPRASNNPVIRYLDGHAEGRRFVLAYDIAPLKSYDQSYGYTSTFSPEIQEMHHHLLTSIVRAYDPVAPEKRPDFFVIIIADITHGLETESILYFDDMARVMKDQSFGEEYVQRAVFKQAVGRPDIFGDREGKHLDVHDLTWPEFLSEQMLYRIRFKYQKSDFHPSENTRAEVLTIAAETFHAYDFKNFDAVELHDLNAESVENVPAKDVLAFTPQEDPPGQGRLIHIQFK